MLHIFYIIHTKLDLQKAARECTLTDHMQYTVVIFICWINHVISATGHDSEHHMGLGTPHGQKYRCFDGLVITPPIKSYKIVVYSHNMYCIVLCIVNCVLYVLYMYCVFHIT